MHFNLQTYTKFQLKALYCIFLCLFGYIAAFLLVQYFYQRLSSTRLGRI